jgi:fructoselysine 6-phosphate deglycase
MALESHTPTDEEIKAAPNPNYLEGDYLRGVLESAFRNGNPVSERIVSEVFTKHAIKSVYLVGSGGSNSYVEPVKYILDRHSDLRIERINSTEFETRRPKPVDATAVVLITSHNGETEDALVAARWAKSVGAITIALTSGTESTLAKICEYLLPYSNELPGMPKTMLAYLFAAQLLKRQGNPVGAQLVRDLEAMPAQLHEIKNAERERGIELARRYKNEDIYYVLSSGILSGLNYQYSICIFNEMLWLDASDIHSGEFRHGPYEVADPDMAFIYLMDNGDNRKLDQRALEFTRRVTDKVITFDAGRYPEVSPLLSPFVIGVTWYWFAHALSVLREHPLSVRRYMWKVDY